MQRQKLLKLLINYCNKKGTKTFSRQDILQEYGDFSNIGIRGNMPRQTVSRLLQELKKDNMLSILKGRGFYTLGGKSLDFLLDEEKKELSNIDLSKEINKDKIEHLRETYYRNTKIVKLAKHILGLSCLYPNCKNTFLKEDKTPYIEVHHIMPLYKNGIDRLENLSVVCAHHHKMAHFADIKTRIKIENILYNETKFRL
jgi:predicted restriction endonuclease